MERHPKISVLMTSCNHAPFVGEQIDSILAQTWDNWNLTISDNGSTDGSWDILKRYESEHQGKIKVVRGPGCFPDNHFSLVVNADPSAEYFAWCDSDDVWFPNKLEMAMEKLEPCGQSAPVLYASRMVQIDASGHEYGLTPLMNTFPPCFGNALIECITIGPTIVFNRLARDLIALGLGQRVITQDWFAYLIITGAGGHVVYDPRPTAFYRLHTGNMYNTGPMGILSFFAKVFALFSGHNAYRPLWVGGVEVLGGLSDRLTEENRGKLSAMQNLLRGDGGPFHRLRLFWQAGLRCQTRRKSIAYSILALMGRF